MKNLKIIFLTIFSVFLTQNAMAADLPDTELVKYINKTIETGKNQSVIVAYLENGNLTVQTFGELLKDTGKKPTMDTLFEMSSISKTFLGSLAAILVKKGELDVSANINTLLPEGVRFKNNNITVDHLLTHFSGLPYAPSDINEMGGVNPYANYQIADLWESVNNYDEEIKPGEKYGYSAFGVSVLAHAIAHQKGKSYFALLKEYILDPLEMNDTYHFVPVSERHRVAQGHTENDEPVYELINQGALHPAGFMVTSANDLMKYLKAHIGLTHTELHNSMKLSHKVRTKSNNVGMAWHAGDDHIERSHFGTTPGFRAYIGFTADMTKAAVALTNTKHGAIEIGDRLLIDGYELPELK